jgi:acetyltransferase-like isoleucine patch superfamily enzyme
MKHLFKRELDKIKKNKKLKDKSIWLYLLFFNRLIYLVFNVIITKIYLLRCNHVGKMVFCKGKPDISNNGKIYIGNFNSIWSNISKTRLSVHSGGEIIIGNNNFLNGVFISASSKVILGNNIKIGPQTMIMDSDFHDVNDHNNEGLTSKIIIEDDVWLGARCTILKGVHIGTNSVVGVGAIVTKDVPKNAIVAGVPAKIIKMKDTQ